MKTYNMPRCKCPTCESFVEAASNPFTKHAPTKGDVTMCLMCGALMAFRKNLTVRALNDEEILRAKADPRVQRLLTARAVTMLRHVH